MLLLLLACHGSKGHSSLEAEDTGADSGEPDSDSAESGEPGESGESVASHTWTGTFGTAPDVRIRS